MATAAPAAPAAPGPVGSAAPPQAPATAPATPAAQSVLRPIPPRTPKLPGVLEDGPEDASSETARADRARDAAGRFVAGEPKVGEPAREPKLPGIRPDTAVPEPPEAKPKFKFAGKEYESPEAAEHEYKSLTGKLVPVQRKLAETEGTLVKAAESARGWHSEAQRLAARVAELERGGNASASTEQTQAPAEPAKGIDWDLYAEISKVAQEAGEPWKAQQWLQEQVDAQRRADIASIREEAIENPRREAEQQAQLESTANTLVESMAAHTNPDGSPAFPEFRDGNTAREVGALWQSLGLDPQLALTPGGAVAAVALYRMARGMDGAVAAPPAASPTPAQPAVPPSMAAEAAAALEGGRPLAPSAVGSRHMDPEVARLVAGLKNTQLIRPGLGFEL